MGTSRLRKGIAAEYRTAKSRFYDCDSFLKLADSLVRVTRPREIVTLLDSTVVQSPIFASQQSKQFIIWGSY